MARKGPRQVVFVCSAVVAGKLVSEMLELETSEEAQTRFQSRHGSKAESVLGPFYRKRTGILMGAQTQAIRFSGKTRLGTYNEWYVKVMMLQHPEDCVWVFFDQRVDGKKQPKPTSQVVRITDVHYLNEEEEKIFKALPKVS